MCENYIDDIINEYIKIDTTNDIIISKLLNLLIHLNELGRYCKYFKLKIFTNKFNVVYLVSLDNKNIFPELYNKHNEKLNNYNYITQNLEEYINRKIKSYKDDLHKEIITTIDITRRTKTISSGIDILYKIDDNYIQKFNINEDTFIVNDKFINGLCVALQIIIKSDKLDTYDMIFIDNIKSVYSSVITTLQLNDIDILQNILKLHDYSTNISEINTIKKLKKIATKLYIYNDDILDGDKIKFPKYYDIQFNKLKDRILNYKLINRYINLYLLKSIPDKIDNLLITLHNEKYDIDIKSDIKC